MQQPRRRGPHALFWAALGVLVGAFLTSSVAHADVGVLAPGVPAGVSKEIRAGVLAASGENVMAPERLTEQLAAARQLGVECEVEDAPCLARLAGLASLGALVVAWPAGDELTLVLIDASASREIARARGARADARRVAERLFSPEARRGALILTVQPEGASLLLDGEELAGMPRSGELPVTPGPHTIRAAAAGFVTSEETVEVALGESVPVTLVLARVDAEDPAEGAPHVDGGEAPLVLWVGAGVAGAGALIAGAGLAVIAFGEAEAARSDGDKGLRDALSAAKLPVLIATGAGAALLLTGVVIAGIGLTAEQ